MDIDAKKRQLDEQGYCIVPDVLDRQETAEIRERLWAAADKSEARGMPTRNIGLDPNEHNVRVFNLLDLDPVFIELIQHPRAIDIVTHLLGESFLISNFTANIALPGSKSMELHSDQGIVVPEPWLKPWSMNIIWCLDDVDEENGATRFIPGSHAVTRPEELPADPLSKTIPFEAKAGSIIAMDGRVWHTSGANTSQDRQRALMFGYYSAAFIRPQTNWNVTLSPETIAGLNPRMRHWLGLEATANVELGRGLLQKA